MHNKNCCWRWLSQLSAIYNISKVGSVFIIAEEESNTQEILQNSAAGADYVMLDLLAGTHESPGKQFLEGENSKHTTLGIMEAMEKIAKRDIFNPSC